MATTIDSILETQQSVPLANQFFDVVTRHDGYTSTYDGHHYYAIHVNNGDYAVVEQTWSDSSNAFVDAEKPVIVFDGTELTFIDRNLDNVYQRYVYEHDAKVTSANVDYFVAAAFKAFADHHFANTAYDVFVEGKDKVLDNLSSVASSSAANGSQAASGAPTSSASSNQPSSNGSSSASNGSSSASNGSSSASNGSSSASNSSNPASSGNTPAS